MDYSVYDVETGIVVAHYNYPEDKSEHVPRKRGQAMFRGKIPADKYLILGGKVVPRPPQPPAPVEPHQVKAEAERRIMADFPLWRQMNMIRAGEDLSAIDAIREASNLIEAMEPIPLDFKDDRYWLPPGG